MRPALALLLLVLSAAGPAQDRERRKAEAYLEEVRSHLREHYIDGPALKDADLFKAGIRAMKTWLDRADAPAMTDAAKDALRKAFDDESRSISKAFDAIGRELGDKADYMAFADRAAGAMVQACGDPYSRLLKREDWDKMQRFLNGEGHDEFLGISITPQDGQVRIRNVQYGTPPQEEGVEIGDEILEINGKAVSGMNPDELNDALRVTPGARTALRLRRDGIAEPFVIEMVQRRRGDDEVLHAMLGHGIGYVRTTLFSTRLKRLVEKALNDLDAQGMRALIFDLRGNPGGSMTAATEVADLFLDQDLPVTRVELHYQPGNPGMPFDLTHPQVYTTRQRSDFEKIPMVVLVNHSSASASELLSGALQDHKRARIVGETTWGKGVGQQAIPLESTSSGKTGDPDRVLYLTILRYFLPSGRSIHHKGVEPEVVSRARREEPKVQAEVLKLRQSARLEKYVESQWLSGQARLEELAENDGFDAGRYPGFDALAKEVGPAIPRDVLRAELRRSIRRRMAVNDGKHWVYDLEGDVPLQCAIVETLDRVK